MKIKFTPTVPKEIEYSMTITMTVKEWIKLQGQLSSTFGDPGLQISTEIRNLIWQAQQYFIPNYKNPITPEPLESIAEIFEKAKAKSTVTPEDHVKCDHCEGNGYFQVGLNEQARCGACEGKGHRKP